MYKNTILQKTVSYLLASSLLLCLIVIPALASDTQETKAQAAAQSIVEMGATSLQYALIEGDTVTLSGQAGVFSRTENTALTEDHIYGIGSVSKIYTTTAVMQLVEQKKISLDAPVTTYIPEFKMADARYEDITVRMLLNHSSGLMGFHSLDGFLFDDNGSYAKDNLLMWLESQTLKADPGAYGSYCNDGFTLAEILVERVSGMTFTEYLHENITDPLGLTQTFTPKDNLPLDQFPKTYFGDNDTALPQESLSVIGTGGLYASATDLVTFGATFYNNKLLTNASTDAMAKPEYQNGLWPKADVLSMSYGLGWDQVTIFPFDGAGVKALAKSGSTDNYHAFLIVLPEHNMAAAVISSGGRSAYTRYMATRLLIDALAEKGITVDETIPALDEVRPADMPAELLQYAGYYTSNTMSQQIGLTADGQITFDGEESNFRYMEDGSFRDEDNTTLLRFVKEETGDVYFYQLSYGQIPGFPPFAVSEYLAQLLPNRDVPEETWALWEPYTNQKRFVINERYSSTLYLYAGMFMLPVTHNETGYYHGSAVIGNALVPQTAIPGNGSREGKLITLVEEPGSTHFTLNETIAIPESSVPNIYAGGSSVCTIQPNGYARWYAVGDAAGKTMTVDEPEDSYFYIYNSYGMVESASILGDSSATLPEGGYIVFVGLSGGQFTIGLS